MYTVKFIFRKTKKLPINGKMSGTTIATLPKQSLRQVAEIIDDFYSDVGDLTTYYDFPGDARGRIRSNKGYGIILIGTYPQSYKGKIGYTALEIVSPNVDGALKVAQIVRGGTKEKLLGYLGFKPSYRSRI